MVNRKRTIILGGVLFATSVTSCYAYLDPGTGSMLLQGLIAGVAASATVISINYHRVKAKISTLLGKNENDAE